MRSLFFVLTTTAHTSGRTKEERTVKVYIGDFTRGVSVAQSLWSSRVEIWTT